MPPLGLRKLRPGISLLMGMRGVYGFAPGPAYWLLGIP